MNEENMRWHFEPLKGSEIQSHVFAGNLMLGSYYIAQVLRTAGVAVNPFSTPNFGTPEFAEQIVRVLNRELPGGKLRVRRKGVK